MWKVDISRLPKEDKRHKPLYMDKTYNEEETQITKYQAKMQWFKSMNKKQEDDDGLVEGQRWRDALVGVWKGARCSQVTSNFKPSLLITWV